MDILGNYKKWRNYRRTVNELSGLSTRELKDIGVGRSEIKGIAKRGQ